MVWTVGPNVDVSGCPSHLEADDHALPPDSVSLRLSRVVSQVSAGLAGNPDPHANMLTGAEFQAVVNETLDGFDGDIWSVRFKANSRAKPSGGWERPQGSNLAMLSLLENNAEYFENRNQIFLGVEARES